VNYRSRAQSGRPSASRAFPLSADSGRSRDRVGAAGSTQADLPGLQRLSELASSQHRWSISRVLAGWMAAA